MHDSSSHRHPEVIQQGILFVAKMFRGEKKDGAGYLNFQILKKVSIFIEVCFYI